MKINEKGSIFTSCEVEEMKPGDIFEVKIAEISREGEGIAQVGPISVLVPGVKPGEKVKIRIEAIVGPMATAVKV